MQPALIFNQDCMTNVNPSTTIPHYCIDTISTAPHGVSYQTIKVAVIVIMQ